MATLTLSDVATVHWLGGLRFKGERNGFQTLIDGKEEASPSPVAVLCESVAACAAIDVVLILEKGRQDVRGLSISIQNGRAEGQPGYLTGLRFEFFIDGDVDVAKARRAIGLSFEKYCSVYHSLRPDIDLEWSLILNGEEVGEG